MFKTASLLEGSDKAPESWMTTICQLGIIIISFPYSIIPHLMSLFSVPKLPVDFWFVFAFFFFCALFPTVFFNFNDIPLQRLLFRMSALLFPTQGGEEGEAKKRKRGREGVREGKDVSITQKNSQVQHVMTLTVGSMINALIYIQLPLDSFRKLW